MHVVAVVTGAGDVLPVNERDVDVKPSKPVLVYGSEADRVQKGKGLELATAAPGGGGGTYEVGGEVRVKHTRKNVDVVALRLEFIAE